MCSWFLNLWRLCFVLIFKCVKIAMLIMRRYITPACAAWCRWLLSLLWGCFVTCEVVLWWSCETCFSCWCGVQHHDAFLACSYCCNCAEVTMLLAITKFVCRLQLAEFVIFLLVMSSLVLRFVLWFLEFLWRQFRQLKWYSCVWFRTCGGCFLWLLFQHVKCTFDSSASVNMMMTMNAYMITMNVCITIKTVMTKKFIGRSQNSCLVVY